MVTTNMKIRIQKVINDDNQDRGFCLRSLLSILSAVYGGVVTLRRRVYHKGVLSSKRLPCIVVSIGNLTMGGTGKTPMTLYVTRQIMELGYTVSIISRGYKGKAEKRGGIVSNGRNLLMSAVDAGDEPFMMAAKLSGVPVIVGQNRFAAGMLAVQHFNPDVLVLDDAFQHVSLRRDIDLVLLDYRRPLGNGFLLPRGFLREPIFSLTQADALILTKFAADNGSENASSYAKFEALVQEKPIFIASRMPYIQQVVKGKQHSAPDHFQDTLTYDADLLQGRRAFPFSGIANHRDFFKTVEHLGATVTAWQEFPDHYQYNDTDYKHIMQAAINAGADCIITTEKDYVRMANKSDWPLDLVVLGVEISFGHEDAAFKSFIKSRLQAYQRSATVKEISGE